MVKYTCIKSMSAPASARAIAAAWPIPLVPPVTRAVCPSKENNLAVAVFAMFCKTRFFLELLELVMRCFQTLSISTCELSPVNPPNSRKLPRGGSTSGGRTRLLTTQRYPYRDFHTSFKPPKLTPNHSNHLALPLTNY